jgi:SAM-dependent methyltransferase
VADPGPQIRSDLYWSREYNTKERFVSFWHQVDEVLSLAPRTVLEVGPGSGIVTDLLRRTGLDVKTLDFDESVGADITGSVTEIPLVDGAVDVVLCSQVLEHIPWNDVVAALCELRRVSRIGAVLSVPDLTPYVGVSYPLYFGFFADRMRAELPPGRLALLRALVTRRARLRDFLFARLVPARWGLGGGAAELRRPPIPHDPPAATFDGQHYWEIGLRAFPLARIESALAEAGFGDIRTYRVPENPWHRFFVLRPEP